MAHACNSCNSCKIYDVLLELVQKKDLLISEQQKFIEQLQSIQLLIDPTDYKLN